MHQVGLLKVACHFCKQFFVRDADVHGKAKRMKDLVFDCCGSHNRSAEQKLCPSHIHKSFVNAVWFHFVGIFFQYFHKSFGIFLV